MRVLVVSDTHGSPDLLLEAVRHAGHTDALLHLGDGAKDCGALRSNYGGDIYQVKGNCDFTPMDANDRMLALGGAPVYMTHGHMYDVKTTLNRLWFRGRELQAAVVCFGHTHVPLLNRQGHMLLLNPGSLRYGSTYAVLTIRDGAVDAAMHSLTEK